MRRTQILMEEGQYQALKSWARGTDRSLSDLVRFAVDRLIGERTPKPRARRIEDLCGFIRDGRGPDGRDHDRILYGKR